MLCAAAGDVSPGASAKVDLDRLLAEQQSEFQRMSDQLRGELRQLLAQQTRTILEALSAASCMGSADCSPVPDKTEGAQGFGMDITSDSASSQENSPRRSPPAQAENGSGPPSAKVPSMGRGNSMISDTGCVKVANWEFEQLSGGWIQYPDTESNRIERQFRRGKSMCHVKSGRRGLTTKEVFFVDMIQLDPSSGSTYRVRRNGSRLLSFRREPWVWVRRNCSAIFQELITGELALQPMADHYQRVAASGESLFLGAVQPDMERITPGRSHYHVATSLCKIDLTGISVYRATESSKCSIFMRRITEQDAFVVTSVVITLLQVAWVVGTMQNQESGRGHLYARGAVHIVVEHLFCIFFSVELAMRYMAFKRALDSFRDGWFLFDTVLVCLSISEVLVMPPLQHFGVMETMSANNQIFRIFRLARIFRFFRVLRRFRDLQVVVKGAIVGMRAAAYVWVLLGLLIFAFGLILFISVQDRDIKSEYFATLQASMQTLFLTGIMLDGVRKLFTLLVDANEAVGLLAFSAFQFFSFFGLLNMLIGAFCNSAMEVAASEQKGHDLRYIKHHLMEILDCYLEDNQISIDKAEFERIMKNREVDSTLRQCGTDVDALRSIKDALFPEAHSQLSLQDLFEVIMSLRANAPACASHIVSLMQRFDSLEQQVVGSRKRGRADKVSV